jgi:hypothetical protein
MTVLDPEESKRILANGTAMRINDLDKFLDQMAEAWEESEKTGEDQEVIQARLMAQDPGAIAEIVKYDENGDEISRIQITEPVETPKALQEVVDALNNLKQKNSK